MPKMPWYPWRPDVFQSDPCVQSLSFYEKGLYYDLLDLLWLSTNRRLPANPDLLVDILKPKKGPDAYWRKWLSKLISLRLLIVEHSQDGNSLLSSPYIDREFQIAKGFFKPEQPRLPSGQFGPKQNPLKTQPKPRIDPAKTETQELQSPQQIMPPSRPPSRPPTYTIHDNTYPYSPFPKNQNPEITVGENGAGLETETLTPHFCPACNLRQMSSACIRCKQPTIACGEL